MKKINAMGGNRIYPGPPALNEALSQRERMIGQFNEGLDRLQQSRQLDPEHIERFNQLGPSSPLRRMHDQLWQRTQGLMQLAFNHQRFMNENEADPGAITTAAAIAQRLNGAADGWNEFKSTLVDTPQS